MKYNPDPIKYEEIGEISDYSWRDLVRDMNECGPATQPKPRGRSMYSDSKGRIVDFDEGDYE